MDLKTYSAIVSLAGSKVRIITFSDRMKAVSNELPFEVDKLVHINEGIFFVKRKSQKIIEMVTIDFQKEKPFEVKQAYQEFTGNLLSFNGNRTRLYIMIELNEKVTLKIFDVIHGYLKFINQIEDI